MEELLNPPQTEPPTPEAPASEGDSPAAPEVTLESLAAERDQARADRDELWDRFVRKQAEFENSRKRAAKEKEEILQFASMEVLRSLLPVLDDFERAQKAPAEGDDYRKGVDLIYKRFYTTLLNAGLAPIEAVGKKFDPHSHQAVDAVQSEEHEDHTVVEEFQRGYEFRGRLLRPAMVKVAVREADRGQA